MVFFCSTYQLIVLPHTRHSTWLEKKNLFYCCWRTGVVRLLSCEGVLSKVSNHFVDEVYSRPDCVPRSNVMRCIHWLLLCGSVFFFMSIEIIIKEIFFINVYYYHAHTPHHKCCFRDHDTMAFVVMAWHTHTMLYRMYFDHYIYFFYLYQHHFMAIENIQLYNLSRCSILSLARKMIFLWIDAISDGQY